MEIVPDSPKEEEAIMAVPEEDRREGPQDRRYHPRETNWPAVFATLVTVMIALLGYSTTILNDIKQEVRATSDRQIADSATYAVEKATLRRDLDEARNRIDTVVLAFQYNVQGRLNYLEAMTGHKAPKESLRPPQQPQLQGD